MEIIIKWPGFFCLFFISSEEKRRERTETAVLECPHITLIKSVLTLGLINLNHRLNQWLKG